MKLIEFSHIYKTFDQKKYVIEDLNLIVEKGEFLTLLGPSGSGKTTSLMMLAGFEYPTQGDILLNGESLTQLPPYKRNFGMVFQQYALFPHLTVLENILFPLNMRKVSPSVAIPMAQSALQMVCLQGFESRKPAQLSGGQQQRVALARALVFKPTLVLMDEPLGALDKQLREQMQLEIKRIHSELDITIIYVTHDQSEALTMSDRIAVFDQGRIQQIDAPEQLYECPQTPFVAQFIGENNMIEGEILETQPQQCVVQLENGAVIKAKPIKMTEKGAKIMVSVRPERIVLNPSNPAQYSNQIKTKVLQTIYLGDHDRLILQMANNREWTVKVPKGYQSQSVSDDSAQICFNSEHCLALSS